jgi:hypothetical protein
VLSLIVLVIPWWRESVDTVDNSKILLIFIYGLIGVAFAVYPFVKWRRSSGFALARAAPVWAWPSLEKVILLAACTLLCLRVGSDARGLLLVLGTVGFGLLARSWWIGCWFFIAFALMGTLPWDWPLHYQSRQVTVQAGLSEVMGYGLFVLTVAMLTYLLYVSRSRVFRYGRAQYAIATGIIIFCGVAVYRVSISASRFHDGFDWYQAWHHWGAYIGPVELLRAGGIPYVDFPVQYGLGPTVLLSLACAKNCWSAMVQVVALTNLLFSVLILICALALVRRSYAWMFLVGVATISIQCLWIDSVSTPSAGALRFLPLMALTTVVLLRISLEWSMSLVNIALAVLWIISCLWSVESLIYTSVVTLGYFGTRSMRGGHWSVVKWSAACLVVIGMTVALAIAGFGLVFGEIPVVRNVMLYHTNPPGAISGSLSFSFILVASLLVAALVVAFYQSASTAAARCSVVVSALALWCALSYYLGRSHESNLVSLLPFMLIVALCLDRYGALRGNVVWATLLAYVICAPWMGQAGGLSVPSGKAIGLIIHSNPFGESEIKQSFTFADKAEVPLSLLRSGDKPQEVEALVRHIIKTHAEPVTIINASAVIVPSISNSVWTTLHGFANYGHLAAPDIGYFIAQGAQRFSKPGWLVLQSNQRSSAILELFLRAYKITDKVELGAVYAVRLVPKEK